MKNKILVVLAIIILAGIVVVAALGFNVDFVYKNYNLVDVRIGQDFNISDIKTITDEVLKNKKVEIQKAGVYGDNLAIKVAEISDEEKDLLNTKINEKFGIENTVDDIEVNSVPSFRLRDLVKSYIVVLCIATVFVLIYMAIRFRKIGVSKVVLQTLILTVVAEILYAAVIAITRYPVNRLVMPVGVIIYIAIVTVLTGTFEKQISTEKE